MPEQTFSEIRGNSFIGKKTPKGYVIVEMERGRSKNRYFILDQGAGRLGAPKRMLDDGKFEVLKDQKEVETVMFFCRRAINELG